MKAGIIAAGLGDRLRAAGITTPKPLLAVGGRPLLAHAVDAARSAGATRIACIVNAETDLVRDYLERESLGVPIDVVQRTTASSAESFLALRPHLEDAPFLLLTVDAILAPDAPARLVAFARTLTEPASVLGVTTSVDDEKPLWAELDATARIRTLDAPAHARHVTAGVYFLDPLIYRLADEDPPKQWTAFRRILAALLAAEHPLYGYDVGPSIDVDRPQDLAAAERFLGVARSV